MEPAYDAFELVHVIKPFRLVDAESYERLYWRRDGVALASGYYVVRWPSRVAKRAFNEDAIFRGPFRERAEALGNLERLRVRHEAAAGVARRLPAERTRTAAL
jgi:hypothetical protein